MFLLTAQDWLCAGLAIFFFVALQYDIATGGFLLVDMVEAAWRVLSW